MLIYVKVLKYILSWSFLFYLNRENYSVKNLLCHQIMTFAFSTAYSNWSASVTPTNHLRYINLTTENTTVGLLYNQWPGNFSLAVSWISTFYPLLCWWFSLYIPMLFIWFLFNSFHCLHLKLSEIVYIKYTCQLINFPMYPTSSLVFIQEISKQYGQFSYISNEEIFSLRIRCLK